MFSNRPESGAKWTRRSTTRNLQTYRYEPIQPYIFREFTRSFQPDYFLDIGANIGYYSLLIAIDRPSIQVFAYEPMPPAYQELVRNVQLNELGGRITCHRLAVSSTEGSAMMDVVGKISGSNALSSTAVHNSRVSGKERVSTTTLDQMHALTGCAIAMKIDVEGHELQAIQGGSRLLTSNQAIVQLEILDRSSKAEDLVSLLNELGLKKIFSAGPDQYFTNDKELAERTTETVEKALNCFVQDFKQPLYVKSRFLPGLGFELSPVFLSRLPSIFRPRFRRKMQR